MVSTYLDNRTCSVQMMIALAIQCERNILWMIRHLETELDSGFGI